MRKVIGLSIAIALGLTTIAALPAGAANGPKQDHVTGSAKFAPDFHIWVNAHSGSNGEDAHGRLGLSAAAGSLVADVVCLDVAGTNAAIGAIVTESDYPGFPVGTEVVRYVQDNGPGASAPPDLSSLVIADAQTCSAAAGALAEVKGNLTLYDA